MATAAAIQSNGEIWWRKLLGPSENWPMPMIEPFSSEEDGLMERCELCRAPIEASQPFMTNSAGLRLVHLACVADEPTANGPAAESGSRGWRSFLQSLIR